MDTYDNWKLRTPEEERPSEEATVRVKMGVNLDGVTEEEVMAAVNLHLGNVKSVKEEYDDDCFFLRISGDFITNLGSFWDEEDAAQEAAGVIKAENNRICPEDVGVDWDYDN